MNIAHLLPYSAHFPLSKHNGRYQWALSLARLQIAEGHTVTIFAAPGSEDPESPTIWKSTPDLNDKLLNNKALLRTAFEDNTYDIYHSHFDYLHYQLADLTDRPIVFTQHWFPDKTVAQAVRDNTTHNVIAVPPTFYMQAENERLSIPSAKAIHHGIDLNLFQPQENQTPSNRLLFVGRITPNKGVLEAIQITLAAQESLDIVGKVSDPDRAYWEQLAKFIDGRQICYLGPKRQEEVAKLMANARALIFPSSKPEAFGQVTIEAQACGTPVIISNIGASSELVDNGKSGFVVESENDYKEALQKLHSIDRKYCRTFAEQFDLKRMVKQYDELYRRLLS